MMLVRAATLKDADAIRIIYTPYVSQTTVSFEEVPPNTDEIRRRMVARIPRYPFLVVEDNGKVCGYAYAAEHRHRSAYRDSIEVSVYVEMGSHRLGYGSALLSELLSRSAKSGFHAAFAAIALPNAASTALHEKMGFSPIGVFREVGCKFGRRIDVGWWQKKLELTA